MDVSEIETGGDVFLGHFAVGFAMKKAAPRTSLGVLLAAPLLLDLLWPAFLLLGWEQVRIAPGDTPFTPLAFDAYPWSHSLLTTVLWGAAFGGVYIFATRRFIAGAWLALGVVSHWLLDALTHRPDLPITPGGAARVGLGLWYSIPATLIVELALFAIGVWVYAASTTPRSRAGRWGFVLFVGLLLIIYGANALGTPPPSVTALAVTALLAWIFPLMGAWIDRRREPANGLAVVGHGPGPAHGRRDARA